MTAPADPATTPTTPDPGATTTVPSGGADADPATPDPGAADRAGSGGRDGSGPGLLGVSHLGLSVRDLTAATGFWSGVMGFTVLTEIPGLSFLVRPDVRMAIGLVDHDGTVAGAFDEHHVGLDHLGLAVPDVPALEAWARHLDARGVPHSGVTASDAGHHLNLRGPDEFPIELFALDPAMGPQFGLEPGLPPTAGTH